MSEEKTFLICESDKNKRLDMFLLEQMPDFTRSALKNLIEKQQVKVNGKEVKSGYKLRVNENVWVNIPDLQPVDILPENIPLNITVRKVKNINTVIG